MKCSQACCFSCCHSGLKVDLSLAGEDCQHAVTDVALCMVTGCALGTDVCHWMFKTKVNMVQGQEDGPLSRSQYVRL